MLLSHTLAVFTAGLSVVFAVSIDNAPNTATNTSPNPNLGISRRCLGLNCKGSILCGESGNNGSIIQALIDWMEAVEENLVGWTDGETITCVGHSICAFYQGTDPKRHWTRDETLGYLQTIQTYGCKTCGSIPVNPGNCHTNGGELTVNYRDVE